MALQMSRKRKRRRKKEGLMAAEIASYGKREKS